MQRKQRLRAPVLGAGERSRFRFFRALRVRTYGDLDHERVSGRSARQWPAFAATAAAAGVRCALIMPIRVGVAAERVGLLSLYSDIPDVLEAAETRRRVLRLVDEASRGLSLATRLSAAERTTDQLEHALESRATIDFAIGVLMAQNRCGPEDAFTMLRRASQDRNVKLRDIAAELVLRHALP